MHAEKWKRKTLPSLKTVQTGAVVSSHYEPIKDGPDPNEAKAPRVLSRALRSLSSSSLDSLNSGSFRSPAGTGGRRLQKTPSSSTSMIERLHRRVSRDSQGSMSPAEGPGSPMELSFSAMELICHTHLKTDVSLLKARSDYLVLTDHCLVRLGSIEAARSIFPQMSPSETLSRSGSNPSISSKSAISEIRFEIPLRSIVATFKEEGSSPRFGIELWWLSQLPRLGFCKTQVFFSLPKERDEWLATIQKACRAKLRKSPINSMIPENLRVRINHIVATTESQLPGGTSQNMIFPVAKRQVGARTNANEEVASQIDGSSFYFVIGPYMCYFVEVLKADALTPPSDLRVKSSSFGTVTLTRFKASVASHEQRFLMSFRSPFGREIRLDLASTHYRRIIEALTRMDRILKPMWPQQFQRIIFDIKGLPAPLQLTSGNDLGGVEQSLQAYCVAFHAEMPRWTIEWHTSSQPAFRLLPLDGQQYSTMQLIAVFRALRYNSFFKAISFKDVDLSALVRKKDYSQYGDSVVHTSLNGVKIPEEHYENLLQAPALSQELHALAFASESIRRIDLTNVFGVHSSRNSQTRASTDYAMCYRNSSEMLRPLLMLSRGHLLMCHSLVMSQNPLAPSDIDDLSNLLVLDYVHFRELELSQCNLGDIGLTKLWTGLSGQTDCLEAIDTSDNQGTAKFEVIRYTLAQLRSLRRLNIAGNTRLTSDESIFEPAAIHSWKLEELDLSGIANNDATIEVMASYLELPGSHSLKLMKLNKCGLTSRQVSRLFRSMGQGRKMTVHINANRLDEGIDDLCGAIACGYAPWSLFMQMLEFNYEASYVKLWKALTVNKTIECLSLAGSTTPEAASSSTCQTVSEFFSNNNTVRFLDISGYDAKLDEGRLGKEFSKALGGMKYNKSIEHLRVRTQMLNINIGDLAEAISSNSTLHTLDCEDNDFSISNLRHLIRHLTNNLTIRHFSAFTQQELSRSVRKSMATAGSSTPTRRNSVMARFKHDRSSHGTHGSDQALVQHLKDEWDTAIAELELILERNKRHYADGRLSDDEAEYGMRQGEREGEGIFSASFGGLASREYESRRKQNSHGARVSSGKHSPGRNSSSTLDLRGLSGGLDMSILRSNSVISSEAVSPTSETGFSSPEQISADGSPTEKLFLQGVDYTFDDNLGDSYILGEPTSGDGGIQMKAYRRPWSDSVGRIDEEDGH